MNKKAFINFYLTKVKPLLVFKPHKEYRIPEGEYMATCELKVHCEVIMSVINKYICNSI